MAFNAQEQEIIRYGKQNGKTRQEVETALMNLRTGVTPVAAPASAPEEPGLLDRIATDIQTRGARNVDILTAPRDTSFSSDVATGAKIAANTAGGVTGTLGEIIKSIPGGKAALDAIGGVASAGFKALTDKLASTKLFSEAAQGDTKTLENALSIGQSLGEVSGNILTAQGVASGAQATVNAGKAVVNKTGQAVSSAVVNKTGQAVSSAVANVQGPLAGVKQFATEMVERVPRFFGRVKEGVNEAAARAEKIRTSTPQVANAVKNGVDERIINTVQQADEPTVRAYKEMVDIAESNTGARGGTLKIKERPEIVAGRSAEDQYKIIETQRKAVGKQIGDAVAELSKTVKVPMQNSFRTMDDILSQQGIKPYYDKAGVRLDFTGTKFTPAERTRIQELYKLATEGGDNLTPKQIYDKDQLFSKLQRESRLEGIGDILVETPEGTSSLFKVFRDVYSNTLDEVSPEDIRALNREYRKFRTLQDDIENSIIKSGNFETTKGVDGAQFAQTNLRRLLSDAQSAADYREIVAQMDQVSRSLGYKGPNPEDLITFATELRKIYPEVIPQTGFTGGIRAGVADIIEKVSELGAPNIADKQKALRELIESFLTKQPQ